MNTKRFLVDGKFASVFSRVLTLLDGTERNGEAICAEHPFPLAANEPYFLHRGECLKFLSSLPDDSIDSIVADPPYCSGGRTSTERTTRDTTDKYIQTQTKRTYKNFDGDSRDQRGFLKWYTLWLAECYRAAKEGAPVVIFTDWRQLPVTTDALQAGGFIWRGIGAWDKTAGCRPQRGRFANQCEYMVWGSKGPMPSDRDAPCLPGVFRHAVKSADKFHVTGKNTDLLRGVVQITERVKETPEGEIYRPVILDPFAGSGTTGVAAIEQGFRFVGCEWGEEIADTAEARLQEAVRANAHIWGAS